MQKTVHVVLLSQEVNGIFPNKSGVSVFLRPSHSRKILAREMNPVNPVRTEVLVILWKRVL